jgi:hypothetical protein
MNYDGATGWLVGEESRGINAMFTMMNSARLGVGVQGLAQSEVAYQNAAAYAKDRLQGRALTGAKFPDKAADPIIVHPDVRRVLMTIRAFNEAARALVLWTALQGDVAHRSPDEKARQAADDHGPAHADHQRRATDVGLPTPCLRNRSTAGTATSPSTAWSSSCGIAASPDDEGQRHPGARSRRPQTVEGWRTCAASVLAKFPSREKVGGRGDEAHVGALATARAPAGTRG